MLNRACVEAAVVAGLALNCQVNTTSRFERKHYFYADAPAGYQITQNRSPIAQQGVGLIEIVTNPTFTCAAQTVAFLEELASLLSFLGVCSANMSMGELRVDVNVSLGPDLDHQGAVVEVKNVNSFHAIKNSVGEQHGLLCFC
ncbi:unnamed protein product [Dibothriocephalus latus]|uniref:Aspartyl/Glutamyl-tRNA(Gln) amidotransferase subunit B/E catalytic domain-containing protein n=1 Tax=Dibothriocephalus latus TaxID=60516 RepID=A0A3P7LXR6_DIBLA|nr:unnamed protein product [Dibothriocephalus latus]